MIRFQAKPRDFGLREVGFGAEGLVYLGTQELVEFQALGSVRFKAQGLVGFGRFSNWKVASGLYPVVLCKDLVKVTIINQCS